MSTPKPGQIRCPTCLRSTPPAAFCTQCGSPIPASARVRPRGMDRDELEERVRRRPGEGSIFRRGQQIDDSPASSGYVPFEPEPEDALAVRPEGGDPSVYGGPPRDAAEDTQQITRPAVPPPSPSQPAGRAPEETFRPPEPPSVAHEPPATLPPAQPPPLEQSAYAPPPPAPPPPAAAAAAGAGEPMPQSPGFEPPAQPLYPPEAYEDIDDRPYGDPEDAYGYPYAAADERGGGGGGGALPIIGFVVLCVLALAVGAVLAGVFTGNETGQATPSPTVAAASPTLEPTLEPTPVPTETGAPATPEPTDGPVTFPDGALYTVEPCGTYEYRADLTGCKVDGTTRDNGSVWILIVFNKAHGTDDLVLQLRSSGETLDRQEVTLGSIVNCGDSCRGLIWGAVYRDLLPGEYQLVLRRNGDFADTATFSVGG